jgi:hypothetical protein
MTHNVFVQVLILLCILQVSLALKSTTLDDLVACNGDGKVDKNTAYALEVATENLSCKSCHGEQCPHWNFALKRTKKQIEEVK